MTIQHLFVYGTLAPGKSNHHVVANIPGDWQEASLKGKLFKEGWGATLGFPAIVPNESGDNVPGLVFSSEQLSEHWIRLDEFEGPGYKRTLVTVSLYTGENIDAFVYALNHNGEFP